MGKIKMFTQDDVSYTKNFKLCMQKKHAHIWKIKWTDFKKREKKEQADYIKSVLTHEEIVKAERFYRDEDTSRSYLSRGLTRIIAQAYTGKRAETVKISTGFAGKPVFTDEKSLKFNISHSGDYILIAFADEQDIGVDIEKHNGGIDIKGLSVFLAEEERKELLKTSDFKAFYELWVRKEAFLKCTGEGLSRRLDSFCIIGDDVKKNENFFLKGIDIDNEYSAAVAIKT